MDRIRDLVSRLLALEPALVISTLAGLLAIATNLGLPAAGVDVDAIVAAAFNLLTIVGMVFGIRRSVYSPATHAREVQDAFETGLTGG